MILTPVPHRTLAKMNASVIVHQDYARTGTASLGKIGAGKSCKFAILFQLSKPLSDLTENNSKKVEDFMKYFISPDWCYYGI